MKSSLSHVALLVPSAEKSAGVLRSYGIETCDPEVFEAEGTKEVYVGSYESQRGLLLILEAISEGPYLRAIKKRGPSLHHIAIDVLSLDEFLLKAERAGWKRHDLSTHTMARKTAWLYLQGVPTLIEVCQKKTLSSKPSKISKIEMPILAEHATLFDAIGLSDVVVRGALRFTIDGHALTLAQLQ